MHAFETSNCTGNSTIGVLDTRAGSRPKGLRSPFMLFKGCTRIGNLAGGVVGKVLGSLVGNPLHTMADDFGDNSIKSVYMCAAGKHGENDRKICLKAADCFEKHSVLITGASRRANHSGQAYDCVAAELQTA